MTKEEVLEQVRREIPSETRIISKGIGEEHDVEIKQFRANTIINITREADEEVSINILHAIGIHHE